MKEPEKASINLAKNTGIKDHNVYPINNEKILKTELQIALIKLKTWSYKVRSKEAYGEGMNSASSMGKEELKAMR